MELFFVYLSIFFMALLWFYAGIKYAKNRLREELVKDEKQMLEKARKEYTQNLSEQRWDQMLLDAITAYEKDLIKKYGSLSNVSQKEFDLETAKASLDTVYVFRDSRAPFMRETMAKLFAVVAIKYMQMEDARAVTPAQNSKPSTKSILN